MTYVSRILNSYVFRLYKESKIAIRLIKNSNDTYQWSDTTIYHAIKTLSLIKWHSRFEHLNISSLKKHLNHLSIKYVNDIIDDWYCDSCEKFKITKQYNRSSQEREINVYVMILIDMIDSIKSEDFLKKLYFFTFTNDKIRYTDVYTVITKNEWFDHLRSYDNLAQTKIKLSQSIERIRTNFDIELRSHKVDHWLFDKDIVFELSASHSQKKNDVFERTERIIMKMTKSTILEEDISDYLWIEVVLVMIYVKNLKLTRAFQRICSQEALNDKTLRDDHLKVLDSIVYVFIYLEKRKDVIDKSIKFASRTQREKLVDYDEHTIYRIFKSSTNLLTYDVIMIDVQREKKISADSSLTTQQVSTNSKSYQPSREKLNKYHRIDINWVDYSQRRWWSEFSHSTSSKHSKCRSNESESLCLYQSSRYVRIRNIRESDELDTRRSMIESDARRI